MNLQVPCLGRIVNWRKPIVIFLSNECSSCWALVTGKNDKNMLFRVSNNKEHSLS